MPARQVKNSADLLVRVAEDVVRLHGRIEAILGDLSSESVLMALRVHGEDLIAEAEVSTVSDPSLSPSMQVSNFYPVYAVCEELDLTVFVTCGGPGPAVPCEPQEVMRLEAVCHFFPPLKIVGWHGGLRWADLAIALMAKWPNLFHSTSAMAPKHSPRVIIDFANRPAPDRVIYAGYSRAGCRSTVS